MHKGCWDRHLAARSWPWRRGWTSAGRRGRSLESREGHVAGRVGLAQAVREHFDLGPARLHAELAAVGRSTRRALADLPGWTVCDQLDAPGAVTALLPPPSLTAGEARARLLIEHAIVTTAAGVERAPGEMTAPTLRLTPHVDTGPEELLRLHDALAALATRA